ncbi:uncharacterized protein [Ptychodera flava]|uniref:uncharacterized protein n=1 Tax=Ptychodera flava TaxID=63121 RepID=UPI00396A10D8
MSKTGEDQDVADSQKPEDSTNDGKVADNSKLDTKTDIETATSQEQPADEPALDGTTTNAPVVTSQLNNISSDNQPAEGDKNDQSSVKGGEMGEGDATGGQDGPNVEETRENGLQDNGPTEDMVDMDEAKDTVGEPVQKNKSDTTVKKTKGPSESDHIDAVQAANIEQIVMKEAKKMEKTIQSKTPAAPARKTHGKKMKKCIYISYSPDAGFSERKFVSETVRQLKENNLSEDIWFDKDEKNTDSPAWFSQRMEAVEKCRAAICFLSESYFQCPVSIYEGRCLLERVGSGSAVPRIFLVLYNYTEIPRMYNDFLHELVDLTGANAKSSTAEKASVVVGNLMEKLEQFAYVNTPHQQVIPPSEFTGEYKKAKICQWTQYDLQEWLYNMGVREFYRQSFAENQVDGFLLMSIMDQDMQDVLGIDSRVVRKKILQQILSILEREHKLPDNWHLRARTVRARPDSVYLVYDPTDVRLAQNLKQDLRKKNLQVLSHEKLGQSKDEFLQVNGPHVATAKHIVVVMTEAAASSPFVFHEVLFADWLGKTIVTAMFKNVWPKLRPSIKAVLGECPAVDFETKMYTESMDVLEHQIKPLRKVPGVVLEQAYLNRMADGLKPLQVLAASAALSFNEQVVEPKVFISYQWDMQTKVQEIRRVLEANGLPCWADISPTMAQRGHSGVSARGSAAAHNESATETLQLTIQRNMKSAAVVLCCITPRYIQSDNCIKDLTLADHLNKPIVPILLRFVAWPPDTAQPSIKKMLARTVQIDLSNDKLYKQNFHQVLERIRKHLNEKPSMV